MLEQQGHTVNQLDASKNGLLLPASYNQQWLWFLDSLAGTSWFYNMPLVLKIKGKFKISAFREAITGMVRRHDSLRTVFRSKNGTVYRFILEKYELPFSVVNAEQFLEEDIKREVTQEAKTRFVLNGNELLFKVRILEFTKENYLLLLTMHHSIFDGWSYDVFFSDLADFYDHYCNGKLSRLLPLQTSYSDYVQWQIQLLSSKDIEEKLGFWKKLLKDVPVLQFPTDYPRPSIQTFEGRYVSFELDSLIVKGLYQFVKETQASPFIVCLTVFYVLLSRYSNQTDFSFGVPFSGRGGAQLENLIGYFTNIIALRVKSDISLTFKALLVQVKALIFEIYDYQDIPFGKVVEQLAIKRDLSRNPLFQILFAYQNIGLNKLSLSDVVIENYREGYDAARFDFAFEIEDRVSTIRGGVYYNVALFSENTIRYVIESFKEILKHVIQNSETMLSTLPLFNQATYDYLLNQRVRFIPTKVLIRDLFEKQVKQYPLNFAIKYQDQQISYAELDRKANQLINFLQDQGVAKGIKIGIGTGRCVELIISMMACFKAGFIYVPLEVDYPVERLKYIVKDAGISVILTQTAWLPIFRDVDIRIIDLKNESVHIEKFSSIVQPVKLILNDPAYIFYTSGTSGTPKGSLISHANISNLLEATRSLFDFNAEDKTLLFHSYAFDVALWEIFSTFCFGATLVIPDKEDILSIERFYELLVKERITILNETPSAFEQLLFHEKTVGNRKLNLRYVILAGEALKPKMLQPWFTYYPEDICKIINMYGITETTVYSTYLLMTKEMAQGTARSLIGKALPGVALYILDESRQLLPPNATGEIYIAGHGIGQGYLNLPELTREKFLPNTLSELGEKIYKTGDLGRYLQNGDIEYLGRVDNQVKIRGYRVELEEIEFIILSHPQVREVLTHVQKDEINDYHGRLIAYVIPKFSIQREVLQKELESLLENKVPYYMRAQIVFLEKFPMMLNNKIDKKQLPKILYPSSKAISNKPSSAIETQIAQMWREILNIEVNDIDTNFFDMGGNSLFAMQLHSRLSVKFDFNLKVVDLFNYTTVRKLSEFVEQKLEKKRAALSSTTHNEVSLLSKYPANAIAIIGMAGRFPKANNLDTFWSNLKKGLDCISHYSNEELINIGVPDRLLCQENFIGASGTMENIALFDAEFFEITPQEARLTDPQQRLFLETAHTALENSGYAPRKYKGNIAVYAGMGDSDYLYELWPNQKSNSFQATSLMLRLSNEKDYLATKVAYKLNLKGPAVNVNTACSSALVAIVKACQGLVAGEADIAIAGGISLILPGQTGYLCEVGSIFSQDGVCKAFDKTSTGTVPSSGVGIIVLKRLNEAIRDGDNIQAVITGYAINNDGHDKASFASPSLQGQANCIRQALKEAKTNPKEIAYIETHGTGTIIGDAIEIQALTEVFREQTDKEAFCALGSVKTTLGIPNLLQAWRA